MIGSSPRMRGSPVRRTSRIQERGIIPAHAGLTERSSRCRSAARDHPRACGAHVSCRMTRFFFSGSSPRMRGSRPSPQCRTPSPGIIPAHAGLTILRARATNSIRDHPRACGAHIHDVLMTAPRSGSSPRMRGSHALEVRDDVLVGIIPAHAGLTSISGCGQTMKGDHPRACGAHSIVVLISLLTQGSSPRMRGSRNEELGDTAQRGIIPAHAGLTVMLGIGKARNGDHPRACGAHWCGLGQRRRCPGSSPRMRGSRS